MKRFWLFAVVVAVLLVATPTVATASTWVWPAKGKVISKFGMRHQPVTNEWRMHNGIDIANKKGTPIVASRGGKVVAINKSARHSSSDEGGGYGNYVVIRHKKGLYSIYAHLSKVSVKTGQSVKQGQKLGKMGNTGLTKTVHLHFGIGPNKWVNRNAKDPLKLLPRR